MRSPWFILAMSVASCTWPSRFVLQDGSGSDGAIDAFDASADDVEGSDDTSPLDATSDGVDATDASVDADVPPPADAPTDSDGSLACTGCTTGSCVGGVCSPFGDGTTDFASAASTLGFAATNVTAPGGVGAMSLTVNASAGFAADDEVLILEAAGADAGRYEFNVVATATATTLTLRNPLGFSWTMPGAMTSVVVVKVFHFRMFTVSPGRLVVPPFVGPGAMTGGVLVVRANAMISVTGTIDATGAGFTGGPVPATPCTAAGTAGGSPTNPGNPTSMTANGGGGGGASPCFNAGQCSGSVCAVIGNAVGPGGGGGGYAATGRSGTAGASGHVCGSTGAGGMTYGMPSFTASPPRVFFGAGGGSGGGGAGAAAAAGGNGGGIVMLFAPTIVVASTGAILAEGVGGGSAGMGGLVLGGAGGGGAGGSILLEAVDLAEMSGANVSIRGGGGGSLAGGGDCGGDGGGGSDGRMNLHCTRLNGVVCTTGASSPFTYVETYP